MCQRCEGYKFALNEQAREYEAKVESLNSALASAWSKARKLREEMIALASPQEVMPLILQVFDHWRHRCCHMDCMLTDDRRLAVAGMIRAGYEWPAFEEAIEGAAVDAFEKRGVRYDDLELICRNGKTFDSFRARARAHKARVAGQERVYDSLTMTTSTRAQMDSYGDPKLDALFELAHVLREHFGLALGQTQVQVGGDLAGDELFTCVCCGQRDTLHVGFNLVGCTACHVDARAVIAKLRQLGGSHGEGQGLLRDREVGQDRAAGVLQAGGPAQGALL